MSIMSFLVRRMAEASTSEPRAGKVFSIVLSMVSMAVLAICMSKFLGSAEKPRCKVVDAYILKLSCSSPRPKRTGLVPIPACLLA